MMSFGKNLHFFNVLSVSPYGKTLLFSFYFYISYTFVTLISDLYVIGIGVELGTICSKPFAVAAMAVEDPGESKILGIIKG